MSSMTSKSKEGETLKATYARLNTLINKCKRFRMARSSEDNNALLLKSLGDEWMQLTIRESQVQQMRKNIGGALALVVRGSGSSMKGKEVKKEEKKKKKKVLFVNSDGSSDEDEVSMKEMLKALALITREYKRGNNDKGRRESFGRRESSGREVSERTEDSERRERMEKEEHRISQRVEE
ncbi:hypothetical protein OSB04_024273 [Centaurea solstitialis]|uniref:Uncharacterized protein n=1 Tax=Centaurea solstitialis TaxID=347529 RepID=A0AA38WDQ0_9ASTR|nr:hypothetical protein OSB04_024273 [Centaurea solstitialis]